VFGWQPAISATCATNKSTFVFVISVLQSGSGLFNLVNHSKAAVSASQNAMESVIDGAMENVMENVKSRKMGSDDFCGDKVQRSLATLLV
jgi:hypothetical protein